MSILHFSGFSGHEETVIMLLFCQVTVIGSFFFFFFNMERFTNLRIILAQGPC